MKRSTIILTLATIVAMLVLAAIFRHYQLRSAVDRYRADLEARDAWAEASLHPPPIPLSQDGTSFFIKALSVYTNSTAIGRNPPATMRMVAPGKAMIGALQPEITDFRDTNSWEDVQSALDQDTEAVELFYQILDHPQIDFHIPYENGFDDPGFFTNLHLVEIKTSTRLLLSSAMMDLHRDKPTQAAKKIRTALALANTLQGQQLEISELVRIASVAMVQGATWEIVQSDTVCDADLAALQKDWEYIDFIQGHQKALKVELVYSSRMLERWRKSNTQLKSYLRVVADARKVMDVDDDARWVWFRHIKLCAQILMWRYWGSYVDELRALKGYEVLRIAAQQADATGAFSVALKHQKDQLDRLGISNVPDGFDSLFSNDQDLDALMSGSVSTLGRSLAKAMSATAASRITATAIAIKRYRLAHGKHPSALADLVPDYLPSIPNDPCDSKPLRYRPNPDGTYLLYSLGENGEDDGGNPQSAANADTLGWLRGRDWVWPQPATSKEIRAWEKRESKKR